MNRNSSGLRALVPDEDLPSGRSSGSDVVRVPAVAAPVPPLGGEVPVPADPTVAAVPAPPATPGLAWLREAATATIGLAIVLVTVILTWRLFGLHSTPPQWTRNMPTGVAPERFDPFQRGKDVLLLFLPLAGAIVGYYTGRVIADRTIEQANQNTRTASAAAQQATATANSAQAQASQARIEKEQVKADAVRVADVALRALAPTPRGVQVESPGGAGGEGESATDEVMRLRTAILLR